MSLEDLFNSVAVLKYICKPRSVSQRGFEIDYKAQLTCKYINCFENKLLDPTVKSKLQ